jgi:hypothetical protein
VELPLRAPATAFRANSKSASPLHAAAPSCFPAREGKSAPPSSETRGRPRNGFPTGQRTQPGSWKRQMPLGRAPRRFRPARTFSRETRLAASFPGDFADERWIVKAGLRSKGERRENVERPYQPGLWHFGEKDAESSVSLAVLPAPACISMRGLAHACTKEPASLVDRRG